MSIREWGLGIIAALSLATCTACGTIPSLSQPETVTAVKEVCLNERTVEESAFCLIGTYNVTVDELAAAREQGKLSPAAVDVLDVAINQTGERVAVAQEVWGAVAGYRAQLAEMRPLADECLAKDQEDRIRACLSAIGYIAVTGKLQAAVSQAQADWADLKPKMLSVINFETEGAAQ